MVCQSGTFCGTPPEKEKHFMERLHDFLCEDLYAALPELNHMSSPRVDKGLQRPWCNFAFCSTRLDHPAVESLSSYLKGKQQRE